MLKGHKIRSRDQRRDWVVPGNEQETLDFAVQHLMAHAKEAIDDHGFFAIALSGGSTPKAIYEKLCTSPQKEQIEWSKWHLFWSDERSVPSDHPDSNYYMAMESGFKNMGIPKEQIHRMKGEGDIEAHALSYETLILQVLKGRGFDFMMLGMGDDGHTASLFPYTEALQAKNRLVVANWVPKLSTWRMTMTYKAINGSECIVVYVLGAKKLEMLKRVLSSEMHFEELPSQGVGTQAHKALWVTDQPL